jgi:hypothetical protein
MSAQTSLRPNSFPLNLFRAGPVFLPSPASHAAHWPNTTFSFLSIPSRHHHPGCHVISRAASAASPPQLKRRLTSRFLSCNWPSFNPHHWWPIPSLGLLTTIAWLFLLLLELGYGPKWIPQPVPSLIATPWWPLDTGVLFRRTPASLLSAPWSRPPWTKGRQGSTSVGPSPPNI